MEQTLIFGPVLLMLVLTLIVWVYMYAKRIPFINSSAIIANDITPELMAKLSPPSVANPSHNLKNLFEVPIIFYVLAFYLYMTNQVDLLYLWASYIFVLFRVLHSAVHCTVNIVMLRFMLYLISCASVFFILIRSAYLYFL